MLRFRHGAPALLALAILFPIGASAALACCAGVVADTRASIGGGGSHCGGGATSEPDGESCCERASKDAVARHCCAGGDAFERPQAGQPVVLDASTAPASLPTPSDSPCSTARADLSDPVPRSEHLYTLHSSLLI